VTVDLANMLAEDIAAGPGADFGKTVTFEASKRKGKAAFTLNGVPVSGIPSEEAGRIDGDIETWTAQALPLVANCPYKPFVGQFMSISGGARCRVINVTEDALGGMYLIDLRSESNG